MTPIFFGAAYTGLFLTIAYLLLERLIHKMQSKPILVQVAGPVRLRPIEIVGNGHSASELLAGLVFAAVEGAAKIATAKGK